MLNREILFRGKRIDNSEWVYGYFVETENPRHRAVIIESIDIDVSEEATDILNFDIYEVDAKTVGRYTGLKDKNGKKIFEGDIIEFTNDEGDSSLYSVQWSDYFAAWVTQKMEGIYDAELMECWSEDWRSYYEIIGNIHDNPELLQG